MTSPVLRLVGVSAHATMAGARPTPRISARTALAAPCLRTIGSLLSLAKRREPRLGGEALGRNATAAVGFRGRCPAAAPRPRYATVTGGRAPRTQRGHTAQGSDD